jgi:hypothetical protein
MLHVIFVLAPSDEIYCVHLPTSVHAVRSTQYACARSDKQVTPRPGDARGFPPSMPPKGTLERDQRRKDQHR